MSDLERIRCRHCGRWIVEVREIDGRLDPVRWRRGRQLQVRVTTDKGFSVIEHAEFSPGGQFVVDWKRHEGPIHGALRADLHGWIIGRGLGGKDVRCGKCGHWTAIPTTL